ncbi:MAG: deoxyribose-phosphate aldolase [Phycisphaerales bacterium]|nr:deoxyribose-phosphate aldolase [Phycisphaerales bacterium]
MPHSLTRAQLARTIDHTLLKPEAIAEQIDRLCDETLEHSFFAVCVNAMWVERCAARLAKSPKSPDARPLVCSVVGFPLGATTTAAKAAETTEAVRNGACEIDMVIPLGALLGGDAAYVQRDVAGVVEAARNANPDAMVKVILESRALSDSQIIAACGAARAAGAAFVKTSTGFHAAGGATVEHVRLMRANAGGMKVKASGGIRDLATALAMIDAGADRLGLSASVAIVEAASTNR